uniref:Protein-serine/threonine phosphatase n=1 Tax=Parascaris univalens TaxID=6257 RepID=A0A915CD77_PARUN
MTNSIDAIITQVQKEEIDPNGQYIGRAVVEDSCSEVVYATPTTARIDCSDETCAEGKQTPTVHDGSSRSSVSRDKPRVPKFLHSLCCCVRAESAASRFRSTCSPFFDGVVQLG